MGVFMTSPLLSVPILSKISDVARVLNGIRAAVAYLERRGVERDKINTLLMRADDEGRDVTETEVAELIGGAQEAIDRLRAASGEAPASEASNDSTPPPESEPTP